MNSARTARGYTAAAVAAAGFALVLTGCSSGGGDDSGSNATSGSGSSDCAAFEQYGDLSGKTVSVYAGITTPEDQPYIDSFKPFEDCTGAKVNYTADKSFEQQILVQAQAGNAPDLAIVPQPGLLAQLVATGAVVAAPQSVADNVDTFWDPAWKDYGTVDGTFYAAPSGASVKSLIWYSPSEFEQNGWKVPTTLKELNELTDTIAATGKKPWCAGIASGEATGWPITDWMEDFVLRLGGPDAFDAWVSHEVPFNSEVPTQALDAVGAYLKNSDYVNGGYGDVTSIASTSFQDGGLTILDGQCSLHKQASFYAAQFPEGTKVGKDGDVFAFYLPGESADDHPVLGAGEFVTAFSDDPAVQALQTYWSTDLWANTKAKLSSEQTNGGWITANNGLDKANLVNPIDLLSVDILQDPNAVFRFDGSDRMPAAVNSVFWKEATNWITGQSTSDTLDKIEASWPAS